MATMPGKTDRFRPNDPTWQPASYVGGFMPNIVADQVVSKSPYYPSSVVDKTFAALGPLTPQDNTRVASVRPSWTIPTWNEPNRMELAAIEKQKADAASLSSLLAYAQGIPDKTVVNPAVAAATTAGNPITKVTAPIKPQSRGGLLDLIFGPSKNGMGGLAGLLGGPNAGGLGALLTQPKAATSAPKITAPGGGGAFVAPHGSPASMASDGHSNALLPASMNNSRWLTGY